MSRKFSTTTLLLVALSVSRWTAPSYALSLSPGSPGYGTPAPAPAPTYGGGYGGAVKIYSPATTVPDLAPASQDAEAAIAACGGPFRQDRDCIADALDHYAEALRALSPALPAELQTLPDVVTRAARRVRAATTKAQAVAAIKSAVVEVHKTISLLKADDPVVLGPETRAAKYVAETLEAASGNIEKAVGL